MKKIICLITALVLSIGVFSSLFVSVPSVPVKAETSLPEKHFILNEDGSYGGSLDESLYGKGAPKNGEFDVVNSPYFLVNDFYNMKSTNEENPLTMYSKFKPYQQTMENSSAFACLYMVLNYLGKDAGFNELSLLQKYEQENSVSVREADVDARTLKSFVDNLGVSGVSTVKAFGTGLDRDLAGEASQSFVYNLNQGYFMLVRYQSPADYGWKVVVGIDQMGTSHYLDDTLIFANPYDVSDHYQDGYSMARLSNFVAWWVNVDVNFDISRGDEMVVIKVDDFTPNFERVERDKTEKQNHYELHHILNADGSYGGTRDKDKYGVIGTKNGSRNVLYSTYYKVNDYYNMKDEGSRLILENYNTFQQTMGASCGLCAMMSVLNYFDFKVDESWEVTLCERYFEVSKKHVYPKGTLPEPIAEVFKTYGVKATASMTTEETESAFPTYEVYRDFMKENLEKDLPVMISARPAGGHWIVAVGFDDMGTENIYDDVIITSDSSDNWDHYQDGYNTYSATHLYRIHYSKDFSYSHAVVYFEKAPMKTGALIAIIASAVVLVSCGVVVTLVILKKKKAK